MTPMPTPSMIVAKQLLETTKTATLCEYYARNDREANKKTLISV
jgi:hypothetical protein